MRAPRPRPRSPLATEAPAGAGQRGIALVMALLVLLVMSMLAAVLMTTVNVESKIASHGVRAAQALNNAEAGVAEAISRIRIGDVPNTLNPRMVTQIFLTTPGSVPVLAGPDSIGLATQQPAGQWLNYGTPSRGPDALSVEYKTNPARTVIYRYDPGAHPAIQTATGSPIFTITSSGRVGPEIKRVRVDVIQKPFNAWVNAALTANVGIDFSGNSEVCGYNHRSDTPVGTKGRPPCNSWELASGHLPGGWSTGKITSGGSSAQNGSPVANTQYQTGFYQGPWDALGMTQPDFFGWVGAPVSSAPPSPKGIFYLDNNSISQDQSSSFAYHGGYGEGLLYVDGDVTFNGNFSFKGLIYVEGNLKINGTFWLLGAMVCRGKTTIKIANGTCSILYSKDAVQQNLAKYAGQFVRLAWHEVP